MCRSPGSLLAPFIFTCFALLPGPANAQEALPISVVFLPEDAHFNPLFDTATKNRVAEAMAVRLRRQFPWQFTERSCGDCPQIKASIAQHGMSWNVELSLIVANAGGLPVRWFFALYQPGDLEATGVPPVAQIVEDIDKRFDGFLAEQQANVLGGLMNNAPLTRTATFIRRGASVFAVLPLQWSHYCSFATSKFMVDGRWNQDFVKVRADGDAHAEPVTSSWLGLRLRPRKWWPQGSPEQEASAHRDHLMHLAPVSVSLESLSSNPALCGGPSVAW